MMSSIRCTSVLFLLALMLCAAAAAAAAAASNPKPVRVAIANSAGETGIMEWLFDDFHRYHPGIDIQLYMAGALQVLDEGRTGKADLIITHHAPSELAFIKHGFATVRASIMADEFAIFGPPEKINDGIWDLDIVQYSLSVSRRMREMIGLDHISDTVVKPICLIRKLIHSDDRRGFLSNLRYFLRDDANALLSVEFCCLTAANSYRWVLLRGKALHDENKRVIRVTGSLTDLTHLKQHALLQYQALHDAVTGLPNRLLLMDRLNQSLITALRNKTQTGVLMIDLNKFKEINDTKGHHAGDVVLQQMAKIFKQALRSSDTVARLGGDEFVTLLPHVDRESATRIASSIIASLQQPLPILDFHVIVGVSIGIALYPSHGDTASQLLKHADKAMYIAKRAGGGWGMASTD